MRQTCSALALLFVSQLPIQPANADSLLGETNSTIALGIFLGLVLEAVPDIGLSNNNELTQTWAPVVYVSERVSLTAGLTRFPNTVTPTHYYAEARYDLHSSKRWRLTTGLGISSVSDGAGPRGSAGVYLGEVIAFGASLDVVFDPKTQRNHGLAQAKLEIRWGRGRE